MKSTEKKPGYESINLKSTMTNQEGVKAFTHPIEKTKKQTNEQFQEHAKLLMFHLNEAQREDTQRR